jgi:hypothetical protein
MLDGPSLAHGRNDPKGPRKSEHTQPSKSNEEQQARPCSLFFVAVNKTSEEEHV